jgi:hypothetical protein
MPMRTWFQSILACFALGGLMTGCRQPADAPPAGPTDVTLNVPGMF